MLSTRMKGRGDGSQTGQHPSFSQELKVQPPAPLHRVLVFPHSFPSLSKARVGSAKSLIFLDS